MSHLTHWKAVVQPQRGYPFTDELFGKRGVGAGTRATETSPGSADPDNRLLSSRRTMYDRAEVAAVGMELQPLTDVAVGQRRILHLERGHYLLDCLR